MDDGVTAMLDALNAAEAAEQTLFLQAERVYAGLVCTTR